MLDRVLHASLQDALAQFPVVGLLGARQVGKTTLARSVAEALGSDALFLDLERLSDQARLQDPERYLEAQAGRLVVLDEIQCRPDLLPLLRALVDGDRRPGRFLLLGSASPDLVKSASESLAGRIRYLELGPLDLREAGTARLDDLWLRGGFPDSFLAVGDHHSLQWRQAFIRTYLERDIPALGLRLPAAELRRFWMMLAHGHGQLWNASALAAGLGVSSPTVRRWLDLLEDTFMVRQLQPWHGNLGKRLVKRPRIYLRDSGLLHALLGLGSLEDLLGHPVAGPSWEGFVLEQVLARIPEAWPRTFYRTGAGAELDLVLEPPGGRPLGIEIKLSSAPRPTRGFWTALQDLDARGFVLCPAKARYPIGPGAEVLPLEELGRLLEVGEGH
jgi:uncharacterized protein